MGEKKKERRMLTKRFFFCFTFYQDEFFFFSWIQALGLGRLPFASVPNTRLANLYCWTYSIRLYNLFGQSIGQSTVLSEIRCF